MIGIVNNAFHGWVSEHLGPEAWLRIAEQVETSVFIGTEEDDDRVTAELAAVTAAETGLSVEDVLERVGEHFGRDCAGRDFGVLLNAGGATYRDFLRGLPDLQTRFALIYPNTKPPRFALADEGPESLTIVHHTAREGLSALLGGVLAGLASVFSVTATVERRSGLSEEGPFHEFRVRWKEKVAPRPAVPRPAALPPSRRPVGTTRLAVA